LLDLRGVRHGLWQFCRGLRHRDVHSTQGLSRCSRALTIGGKLEITLKMSCRGVDIPQLVAQNYCEKEVGVWFIRGFSDDSFEVRVCGLSFIESYVDRCQKESKGPVFGVSLEIRVRVIQGGSKPRTTNADVKQCSQSLALWITTLY